MTEHPTVTARREPTTDQLLINMAPYRAETTYDVVYRDSAGEEVYRMHWYHADLAPYTGQLTVGEQTYNIIKGE